DSGGTHGLILPMDQVEDVRAGLTFLRTLSFVDPDRLGLLGSSFGGGIATVVAAMEPRVKALACISSVASGSDWLRESRRHYEWMDWLKDVEQQWEAAVLRKDLVHVDPLDIMMSPPERRALSIP